jgi:hypothetical protein
MMQQQTSANTRATINKEKILRSKLAVNSYQLSAAAAAGYDRLYYYSFSLSLMFSFLAAFLTGQSLFSILYFLCIVLQRNHTNLSNSYYTVLRLILQIALQDIFVIAC